MVFKMKILVITDIHYRWKYLKKVLKMEEYDVIVVAGDLSRWGDVKEAFDVLKTLTKHATTFFVPGNCDNPSLLRTENVYNAINLHGKVIEHNGLVFAGIGGSNTTPFNTPIEFTEDKLAEIMDQMEKNLRGKNIDIMVSHTPPYATKLDIAFSGEHVGSIKVREFLEKHQPLICICGHIHESQGMDKLGRTIAINPGPIADGKYAIVELDERKKRIIKVEIKKIR